MRLVRYLQYWLSGSGTPLQVTDFVPKTHPIRQWADTFDFQKPAAQQRGVARTSFRQHRQLLQLSDKKRGLKFCDAIIRADDAFLETVRCAGSAAIYD